MALLVNIEDARSVLPYDMEGMRDVLDALEKSYKDEGLGKAVNRTKSAVHIPTSRHDEWHRLTTFVGGVRSLNVSAIRIKPDITYQEGGPDSQRISWYTKQRGTFGALVLLFSAEDGQLLAILNDGSIQSLRVGATAGLAARHMARTDARIVGILGSSGLARAHALAYANTVPNLELFKVYSPNQERRKAFAEWLEDMTGIQTQVVQTEQQAQENADIIASCTNQTGRPTIRAHSLRRGLHFTVVINSLQELEKQAIPRIDRVVEYVSGPMEHLFTTAPDHRPPSLGGSTETSEALLDTVARRHTLPQVLLGKAPGRESEQEVNFFLSEGTAVQFATMAALVYERCLERGIGRELNPEWFLQPTKT